MVVGLLGVSRHRVEPLGPMRLVVVGASTAERQVLASLIRFSVRILIFLVPRHRTLLNEGLPPATRSELFCVSAFT